VALAPSRTCRAPVTATGLVWSHARSVSMRIPCGSGRFYMDSVIIWPVILSPVSQSHQCPDAGHHCALGSAELSTPAHSSASCLWGDRHYFRFQRCWHLVAIFPGSRCGSQRPKSPQPRPGWPDRWPPQHSSIGQSQVADKPAGQSRQDGMPLKHREQAWSGRLYRVGGRRPAHVKAGC
jgi:hypothetical protein